MRSLPIAPSPRLDPRDAVWQDLAALVATWRADVIVLRRRASDDKAALIEQLADELERRITERGVEAELLTLDRAAHEAGLSYSGVWKAVKRGSLTNYGQRGQPRVKRGDLLRLRKPA